MLNSVYIYDGKIGSNHILNDKFAISVSVKYRKLSDPLYCSNVCTCWHKMNLLLSTGHNIKYQVVTKKYLKQKLNILGVEPRTSFCIRQPRLRRLDYERIHWIFCFPESTYHYISFIYFINNKLIVSENSTCVQAQAKKFNQM